MQGSISIERMCQLAEVSRAGFYRSLRERTPAEEDMELRSSKSRWNIGAAMAIVGYQRSNPTECDEVLPGYGASAALGYISCLLYKSLGREFESLRAHQISLQLFIFDSSTTITKAAR